MSGKIRKLLLDEDSGGEQLTFGGHLRRLEKSRADANDVTGLTSVTVHTVINPVGEAGISNIVEGVNVGLHDVVANDSSYSPDTGKLTNDVGHLETRDNVVSMSGKALAAALASDPEDLELREEVIRRAELSFDRLVKPKLLTYLCSIPRRITRRTAKKVVKKRRKLEEIDSRSLDFANLVLAQSGTDLRRIPVVVEQRFSGEIVADYLEGDMIFGRPSILNGVLIIGMFSSWEGARDKSPVYDYLRALNSALSQAPFKVSETMRPGRESDLKVRIEDLDPIE